MLPLIIKKKPSWKWGFFLLSLFVICFLWLLFLKHIHFQCPILTLFHIYCPGCGGTRMVHSLIHFDFYQAFRYNPLLFLGVMLGGCYLLYFLFCLLKKKEVMIPSIPLWILVILLLLLYMVLRNMDSFVYLIPTEV